MANARTIIKLNRQETTLSSHRYRSTHRMVNTSPIQIQWWANY